LAGMASSVSDHSDGKNRLSAASAKALCSEIIWY
jgi:hypothetical protein